MCQELNANDYTNYPWDKFLEQSYSPQLLHKAVGFRNGDKDVSNIAGIARIIVGEFLFPGVATIALIEGVVRAVFCLLALIPSLVCEMPTRFDTVVDTLGLDVLVAIEVALRSIKGFIISPFNWDDLEVEDLSLGCVLNCSGEEDI
jgi:hypothetical protein